MSDGFERTPERAGIGRFIPRQWRLLVPAIAFLIYAIFDAVVD
ncbi:MAG: hypothetical protein ACK8QZ_12460 [Anaerolineales bacterium]